MNLLQIAAVQKANGTEGEILVGFKDFSADELDTKEPVFITFDGLPVPFFVEGITPRGRSRALVHLTGVSSLDDAQELCGRTISVRAEDYPDLSKDDGLEGLIGWKVQGADGEAVGTITGIEDIPGNPCVDVKTDKGQYLLPLSEELILSVNEEKGIIRMHIPDGLLTY